MIRGSGCGNMLLPEMGDTRLQGPWAGERIPRGNTIRRLSGEQGSRETRAEDAE
jgi:hypothetical protein